MRLSITRNQLFMLAAVVAMTALTHFGVMEAEHALIGFAALNTTPFATNPELTAVAIGYKNLETDLIADEVMPRVPTAETFKWTEYDTEQAYTLPDTKVGRRSDPNIVTFGGTERMDAVEDFGLDDPIPQRDLDVFNAMPKPSGGGLIDPRSMSTMMLAHLIMLSREVRVAAKTQDANNFLPANVRALTGSGKWSDYANSDPFKDLLEALDKPLVRPNLFIIGQSEWTVLRQNPKFVQQIKRNKDGAGVVTRAEVAESLELSKVLIGAARLNTARKGQAASFARVWGNNATLIHSSQMAAQAMQPTWGWTAQFGTKIAGEIIEPKKGLRGSVTVRCGEQVKEVVAAKGAGYLFQNVI